MTLYIGREASKVSPSPSLAFLLDFVRACWVAMVMDVGAMGLMWFFWCLRARLWPLGSRSYGREFARR